MPSEDIPGVTPGLGDGLTGQAEAVLREIATLLERLAVHGEEASLDLKSLPLSPADRDWLRQRLGRGEVNIDLTAGGTSRIDETGLPGVWWVEHRDEVANIIGEYIEVARVPAIVPADPDGITAGLDRLRSRLDVVRAEGGDLV